MYCVSCVPSGNVIGCEMGMWSSIVATRIVPWTGGHSLKASRMTLVRNGRRSTAAEYALCELLPSGIGRIYSSAKPESAEQSELSPLRETWERPYDDKPDDISWRRRVWTDGWRARKWRHHERATETESDPASRKVEHWSSNSTSERRFIGSDDRLDLTVRWLRHIKAATEKTRTENTQEILLFNFFLLRRQRVLLFGNQFLSKFIDLP